MVVDIIEFIYMKTLIYQVSYFLENDKASYPLFHDPRQGAAMTALPEKDDKVYSFQVE